MPQNTREGFFSEIAAHPRISNWQVQQARDSLELDYEKFRGIALSPRDTIHSDTVAVSVHSNPKPFLRNPSSNVFARNDNPMSDRVYTRMSDDVNTKVDKNNNKNNNTQATEW